MRWTSLAAVGLAFAMGGSRAWALDEPCPPDRTAEIMTEGAPAEQSALPAPSRLRLNGGKVLARPLQRSEAGLSFALSPKLALELNYARNAFPPMFQNDHDDGILTRLKLGF